MDDRANGVGDRVTVTITPNDVAAHLVSIPSDEAEAFDRKVRMLRAVEAPTETLGLLGQRVTLGSLIRDGVPPVPWLESATLGERLFYRDSVFIVSGHKKSGKSWAMLTTALDCVREGRPVVYLDFENGRRRFARRLTALGGRECADVADEHLHYIESPRNLSLRGMAAELDAVAEALPGAFVIVDSLRGYMARVSPEGRPLNPDRQEDIEAVCAPLSDAAHAQGLTVGIIDHAKKNGSDDDEYSTAGSLAKEAAVDAVYFWTKDEPYNIDTRGVVKIKATSDRDGELDFVRYYFAGGQGQGQPFRFIPADADEVGTMGKLRSRVFDFLADREGETFTPTDVEQAVTGKGKDVRRALELVEAAEPHVFRQPGSREGSWRYGYDRNYSGDPNIGIPV